VKQTNIRIPELFKKQLQYKAIEKGQSFQDTILDYAISGLALEKKLELDSSFQLPAEFEVIKETIKKDVNF